jgi:hypothetical protein
MERKPKQYYYYFNGAKKNLLLFLKDINFKKKAEGVAKKGGENVIILFFKGKVVGDMEAVLEKKARINKNF